MPPSPAPPPAAADNIQYAKAVKLMGTRERAAELDFSEFLEEEVEAQLKEAGAWPGAGGLGCRGCRGGRVGTVDVEAGC